MDLPRLLCLWILGSRSKWVVRGGGHWRLWRGDRGGNEIGDGVEDAGLIFVHGINVKG